MNFLLLQLQIIQPMVIVFNSEPYSCTMLQNFKNLIV